MNHKEIYSMLLDKIVAVVIFLGHDSLRIRDPLLECLSLQVKLFPF